MKETAVDWLVEQIESKNGKEFSSYYTEFVEQAKEMEKEQIIEARFTAPILPDIDKSDYLKEAERYYNKTFKSEIINCKHKNELMRQGDGFVYVVCEDCGIDL